MKRAKKPRRGRPPILGETLERRTIGLPAEHWLALDREAAKRSRRGERVSGSDLAREAVAVWVKSREAAE